MRPADNIERLIKELRHDPDAETYERILGGVLQELGRGRRQEPGHTRPGGRKIIMSSRITKLATAAIIVVGLSIAISYISTDQPNSGIALADVFKAMSQVTTITWTEIYEPTIPEGKIGVDDYGHVARCYFRAPAQRRREETTKRKRPKALQFHEDERIVISDGNVGKGLRLNPEEMTARVVDFTPKGGNDPILGKLMDPEATIPQDAEDLGVSQIDGRDAVGFRLRKKEGRNKFWSGEITDIWVDVKTKRVILLETGNPGRHLWIMKDFVFNQELDDSLFSVEPPEGYTIDTRPMFHLAPSRVKKPASGNGKHMTAPKP